MFNLKKKREELKKEIQKAKDERLLTYAEYNMLWDLAHDGSTKLCRYYFMMAIGEITEET